MRAYRGEQLGSLADFALVEMVSPRPGRGKLLVRVEAVGLGFVDPLVMRGLYQTRPPVPFVPGGEIVGIVEQVGEGVSRFVSGQRVASWQFGGGLADKAIISAEHTVAVPEGVPAQKAAALLLDCLTAYYGLFDRGGLKPGQTLLVTGASGGVGSAAVQLASASASTVIGLASSAEKRALVAALGASLVIDYRENEWRDRLRQAHPNGVDMVFDTVGGDLFQQCFRSLAKKGRHLVVGFAAGDGIPSLPANLALLKSGELIGVDSRYLWDIDAPRVREILSIVLVMAQAGRIDPPIARIFALENSREAVAFVSAGDRLGKVVVVP